MHHFPAICYSKCFYEEISNQFRTRPKIPALAFSSCRISGPLWNNLLCSHAVKCTCYFLARIRLETFLTSYSLTWKIPSNRINFALLKGAIIFRSDNNEEQSKDAINGRRIFPMKYGGKKFYFLFALVSIYAVGCT